MPFATAPRQALSLDSKINLLWALLEVKPVDQERAGSCHPTGDSARGRGSDGAAVTALSGHTCAGHTTFMAKGAPGVLILVAWFILELDTESFLMKNHHGRS